MQTGTVVHIVVGPTDDYPEVRGATVVPGLPVRSGDYSRPLTDTTWILSGPVVGRSCT